jgi:hypothetical protein
MCMPVVVQGGKCITKDGENPKESYVTYFHNESMERVTYRYNNRNTQTHLSRNRMYERALPRARDTVQ